MIYPKTPFCPMGDENCDIEKNNSDKNTKGIKNSESTDTPNGTDKSKMLLEIQQLDFAVTELNLFLDTHPNDEEALNMFVKTAAAAKSLRHDYVSKYGPVCVTDSADKVPFEWVDSSYNWPWQM